MGFEGLTPDRLTGLGQTYFYNLFAFRLTAKVVIETDDTVYLSTRNIKRFSDAFQIVVAKKAHRLLNLMQNLDETLRSILVFLAYSQYD